MKAPVFYDPSGKRKRWSLRALFLVILSLAVTACVFALTIVHVPVPSPLDLRIERPQPRPLPAQIARVRRVLKRTLGGWMPVSTGAAAAVHQQVVAFYVPWDDASRASLVRHIGQIDWLVPVLATVNGPRHDFKVLNDRVLDAVLRSGTTQRPKILPLIQNFSNGVPDGPGFATLLRDPKARAHLLDQIEPMLARWQASGAVFDFEDLPPTAQRDYLRFLVEAKARFAPKNLLVTVAVPVGDSTWNLKAYARIADRVFIMDYDEHETSSAPGPIASQRWFVERMREAVAAVGPAKSIVAIANYGYDWEKGNAEAGIVSVEEVWLTAHDSQSQIRFDPDSGNSTFAYSDDDGHLHTVWFLDAASGWNQLRAADAAGVSAVALWRLGSEDPGVWDAFKAFESKRVPDLMTLRSVGDVDVEGNGELLRITDTPTVGHRIVDADGFGLIRNEILSEPADALCRDPDRLQARGRRADLRRRSRRPMDAEDPRHPEAGRRAGHLLRDRRECGEPSRPAQPDHRSGQRDRQSQLHPSQHGAGFGAWHAHRVQRHATPDRGLYRARHAPVLRIPYFGDAEPTTDDELVPALRAQDDGYVNVGLHVDTEDWTMPGAAAIVRNGVEGVEARERRHARAISCCSTTRAAIARRPSRPCPR